MDYLVISVDRMNHLVYVDSDIYIREGNTSHKLSPREAYEYGNEHRSV